MIELSLWEDKQNSWEIELIKNPEKYQLRNVPELSKVIRSGLIKKTDQEKEDSFLYDLGCFKKFIIFFK